MEVVHIVRQYRPSVGGLEDAVHNLCTHLMRREGIKARVITLDRVFAAPDKQLPRHEIIDGIPVTRISYFGSRRYPVALSVLREVGSASLVHVHAIDFFFDYMSLTRFIHRKPMVATTHGGFFHTAFASKLKKVWFQTITRFSCYGYKALCTSSENDAATFRQIASSRIVNIENGVNIDKWKSRGSATPQRTMIFIGRWSGNKGVPVLIDLVAALGKQGATWTLIIAGIPAQETSASLKAHATRLGVESQICIHEGPSEADIASLIGEASFIASASRYEGFGISAVEGLSAGLVPLLSPIPPFEKLRQALGLGAVIDEKDLERSVRDVEQSYTALAADSETMRQKCMALAKRYDWAGVTDSFVEVYRKALNDKAAARP